MYDQSAIISLSIALGTEAAKFDSEPLDGISRHRVEERLKDTFDSLGEDTNDQACACVQTLDERLPFFQADSITAREGDEALGQAMTSIERLIRWRIRMSEMTFACMAGSTIE
ncbi:hypothetical protein [Pseudomonas gingeri]